MQIRLSAQVLIRSATGVSPWVSTRWRFFMVASMAQSPVDYAAALFRCESFEIFPSSGRDFFRDQRRGFESPAEFDGLWKVEILGVVRIS